ncbi:response regulator [Endozoicomonas sp. SCSIO W0465]|uniref:response regulator n=1 Tax=Endozoicomonas sp. SCSIO W0465 TaxID=2918516 RepID=UPI002075997C|nr:response regulator [Endozoicomonas sp. SCSIO W0465]USE37549.1 response regulator [Endozoicomonas sp. SCSIO W0465]
MSSESSSENSQRKTGGLALTLFLWFIVLSIGPVVIVGLNEYQTGKEAIIKDRYDQLSSVNFQLTQRINEYFDTVLTNLFIMASPSEAFITELVMAPGYKTQPVSEFINSREYGDIYEQYSMEYVDFLRFYDYSDVILGDAAGNILYTVNEYSDLGRNLFSSELENTLFSQAVKASFYDQQPKYADLAAYPPIGNENVVFLILPLADTHQKPIGFIAVQIHPKNIQVMFDSGESSTVGLSSFLVGKDRKIRFGTQFEHYQALEFGEDNPLINLWLSHLEDDGSYRESEAHFGAIIADNAHSHEESGEHGLESFSGDLDALNLEEESVLNRAAKASLSHIRSYLHGEEVLGIYLPINIAGTPMAMLSEVTHRHAFASVQDFRKRLFVLIAITFALVVVIAFVVTRQLVKPIRLITRWVNRVAAGDYEKGSVLRGNNEISELSRSFAQMTDRLRTVSNENTRKNWLQEGMAGLYNSVRGEQDMAELCRNIVTYIARYLDMHSGAMFVKDDKKLLQLMGTYAWRKRNQHANCFEMGEGLIGQAALEREVIEITRVPDGYMDIESGLGCARPGHLIIVPLCYENELKGVFEFARLGPMTDEQSLFLDHSVESIAIAINSAQYRTRVNQLLDTTTLQSEALKEQKEELRSVNEELEKRAGILEESEEELKAQSEELQKSNAELEELSEQLMIQKEEIERKNKDIKLSSKKITEKAEELARASQYKSEFLANMSHELRTPLNSLLLLSQMLAENDEGNLTEDQVESAQVIYNGGKELLELINDILDLSKVEAGKMSVNLDDTPLEEIKGSIETMFNPLAESRSLQFRVCIERGASKSVFTDSQRLMQIVKNFLSNAFKFTEQGSVQVSMFNETRSGHFSEDTWLGFAVKDSGIGIPKEKQASIFGSFQQADGSTSRKYGGTGLGLAISKEMAELLGGFIELESKEDEGTTFTLFLPVNPVCSLEPEPVLAENYVSDVFDQSSGADEPGSVSHEPPEKDKPEVGGAEPPVMQTFDYQLLVIEDDPHFVAILHQLADKHQFGCLYASTGEQGLALARQHQPSAIILDLGLPDMDGQEVLSHLKSDEETRHIPVHIVSGRDPGSVSSPGAVGYLMKPVSVTDIDKVFLTLEKAISQDIRDVLILDLDAEQRSQLGNMLEQKGLHVGYASSATDAEKELDDHHWHCLIMDLELGEIGGLAFLEKMKGKLGSDMPSVVIHTARPVDKTEHSRLQEFTNAIVIKGERALERLTDEVSLFLHTINEDQVDDKTDETVTGSEKRLDGHKILLVDDDLRNTFALSKALQGMGLDVVLADHGKNAISKLEEEDGIELVLMDIMMPVMDGYEATAIIRQKNEFKELPVIALTAKAMADDKAKCLEAGANDYMTKPLDMDKLTAMLKVWLLR